MSCKNDHAAKKQIVQSWCEYEEMEHKEPPCIAECRSNCRYMLLMYEDGYSIFGNETPNECYEKP